MIVALLLLLVALLLVLATGFYVAAEFSLVTVDRATVTRRAEAGDASAASLLRGLASLSTLLSGAQVGITVTTLVLGWVMQPSLAVLLGAPLQSIGLSRSGADTVAGVVALVVATALSMLFGELVPKSLAMARPLATATRVVGGLRISTAVLKPLVWVLDRIANSVLRLLGIRPQEELRSARSPDELRLLVRRSATAGTLERGTAGLLVRSLGFADRTAADVLTPRPDVRFLRIDDSAAELVSVAVGTGFSRFPVFAADHDDVVGVVHLKRAVAVPAGDRARVTVADLMEDVPVVPESLPLGDLLDTLRGHGFQLAVVVDEYGGTAGLITLEDVIEELVGNIADEHDRRPSADQDNRNADGTWSLEGTSRPDEIGELTGVSLPESGGYETIAGLVLARLGHIPASGESVIVEATLVPERGLAAWPEEPGDRPVEIAPGESVAQPVRVRLTVQRMDGRRIATVRLSAVDQGAAGGDR